MELIAKSESGLLMYKIDSDAMGDIVIVTPNTIELTDVTKFQPMYINIYMKFTTDSWTFFEPIEKK